MAVPDNILQTVETYQQAEMAWMLNNNVGIAKSNKKFKDFENRTANLGNTVTFELAPRASTGFGLVIDFQQTQQRVQSLACTQAAFSSYAFTDQQFIFQAIQYMDEFGKSRSMELATQIESDILKNITSGVTILDPQNPLAGQPADAASGPYRFFGDGTTNLDSYQQLAQAMANFRDYGSATMDPTGIIPVTVEPQIVGSGLQQFANSRNDEIAETWRIGDFAGCEWTRSNLLPVHVAGTAGNTASTLTLVSTNDPTGNNITQLTFSSALGNDAEAIKSGDLLQFDDGVAGQPNMRYLTFIGHKPSNQPVQLRATADAASIAGTVTVDIFPALQSTPGLNQNLNNALAAGMEVSVVPSHRAGVIWSGNPLYMAMPRLPDESPFDTVSTTDAETGASLRHYWGSQFGQNNRAYVHDVIWGSTLVAENSMRLVFPLTQ